jgi:hypothetical protein
MYQTTLSSYEFSVIIISYGRSTFTLQGFPRITAVSAIIGLPDEVDMKNERS